jgi:hypothetical protein
MLNGKKDKNTGATRTLTQNIVFPIKYVHTMATMAQGSDGSLESQAAMTGR